MHWQENRVAKECVIQRLSIVGRYDVGSREFLVCGILLFDGERKMWFSSTEINYSNGPLQYSTTQYTTRTYALQCLVSLSILPVPIFTSRNPLTPIFSSCFVFSWPRHQHRHLPPTHHFPRCQSQGQCRWWWTSRICSTPIQEGRFRFGTFDRTSPQTILWKQPGTKKAQDQGARSSCQVRTHAAQAHGQENLNLVIARIGCS